MWLNDVNHSPKKKNSLIGLHAFTGNDSTSSFFRSGKLKYWGAMNSQEKFVYAFERLGNYQESINVVRHQMFMTKYVSDNKCIDMSALDPCPMLPM